MIFINNMKIFKSYIEKYFSCIITLICLLLFSFNLWLFWPGYLGYDWADLLARNFPLNDWHPVIYPFLLKLISQLFGYHIYYPLLFNLIPFYIGIDILILGLWKKFQSKWCLLGMLPIGIANIYFNNIILHSSFSSPMFIFLLWMIVLYQILVGITRQNSTLLFIAFVFAVLSRHNALIQVYPIFFIYSCLIIQKLKTTYRLLKYTGLLIAFAGFTTVTAFGIPKLLKNEQAYPTNHIFLSQIAGACIPNHDENCFKKEWYREGKTFADVETEYMAKPVVADGLCLYPNPPLLKGKLEGLHSMWLKAITTYFDAYIEHIKRYIDIMWHQHPLHQDISITTKNHTIEQFDTNLLTDKYSKDELFYEASALKIQIYEFLKKILPEIPTIFFISLSYILFIISGILFIKNRDILLLYSLSASIAGITSSIIFCIFSPVTYPRYIYPVLISSLISLVGMLVWLFNHKVTIRAFNFNEFIKKAKKQIGIIDILVILCGIYFYLYGPLKARVDVSSPYTDEPAFIIPRKNIAQPMSEASWMPQGGSRGVVVQKFGNTMTFMIVALQDADVTIDLRGPDTRNSKNEVLKNWVKYTSFKINGKSVIFENQDVWHNQPFKHVLHIKKNNAYTVKLKWRKK